MPDSTPTQPEQPTKWYVKLLDDPKALFRLFLFLVAFVGYDLTVPAQRATDAQKRADDAANKLEDAFKRLTDLENLLKDVKSTQAKMLVDK